MQQRCGSCSCVNVGGDQAVALSLGFGHSYDDNNKTITKTKIPTTSVASVYMEGNRAVALSLGFGHSHDDNKKTITMKTRARGLKVPRFQVSRVS